MLRALETSRPRWFPRAAWDLNQLPTRPILTIAEPVSRSLICEAAVEGIATLFSAIDFGSAKQVAFLVKFRRAGLKSIFRISDRLADFVIDLDRLSRAPRRAPVDRRDGC